MNNPTQIASEKANELKEVIEIQEKGELLALKYGGYNNIPVAYCYGYEDYKNNAKRLDFIKHEILAYRTAWENELERWNELELNPMRCPDCADNCTIKLNRISELTSALKILEIK
jgi:hypothetical protein